MDSLRVFATFVARFRLRASALALGLLTLVLFGCFPGGLVTKDFSEFETYEFKQTTGLGFCGDTERAFSVKIARNADGTLAFSHSVLAQVSRDPNQCDDGVATDAGCFRPKAQPSRTLTAPQADRVKAVFSEVSYYRGPDKICRGMGIDPCMIERHSWDDAALSDYICGADRISDDQRVKLKDLLIDLQNNL